MKNLAINKFEVALIGIAIALLCATANIPSVKAWGGPGQMPASAPLSYVAKLPVDLQQTLSTPHPPNATCDVIVEFKELDPSSLATVKKAGGTVKTRFDGIRSMLVSMPVDRIPALATSDNVVFITPDRKMSSSLDSVNVLVGTDQVRRAAQSVYGNTYPAVDGTGIGVAVIDSGLFSPNQDDFHGPNGNGASRIVAFKDWAGTKDGAIKTVTYDDYGHGTPVSGVIAGNGWASRQVYSGKELYPGNYGDFTGIAPNANLIELRVIKADGTGAISNAIAAIDYAVQNKARYNIRVINLSLGAPVLQSYKTDPLCLAAKRAFDAGIVVVAAAGNNGHNDVVTGYDANNKPIYQTVYASISSPGNSPYVITVGAAKDANETILKWHLSPSGVWVSDVTSNPNTLRRSDMEVATFSSRGPTLVDGLVKPDVIAPGVKVVAANARNNAVLPDQLIPGTVVPNTAGGGGVPTAYVQLSGTSFAAPVVSGIAALMLQANPSLTPREAKALMMFTAQRVNESRRQNPQFAIQS